MTDTVSQTTMVGGAPKRASVMGRIILAILIVVGLDAPVMAAVKKVKLKTNYVYYDIRGSTAAELYAQMDQRGPYGSWALVSLLPQVSASCICKNKCKVRLDSFTLSATIILPRWKAPRNTSQTLRFTWKKLVATMKKEEILHRDIAYRTMNQIRRDLSFLRSKKSCASLQKAVDKLFRKRNYAEGHKSLQGRFHRDVKLRYAQSPPLLKD